MDTRLVAWARSVKARSVKARSVGARSVNVRADKADRAPGALRRAAVLWLFTDAERMPDPRAAVACLPRGLAGVVLRHDGDAGRERLARDLARICRTRRLALAVAGDWRLAARVGAGLHLREGRRPSAAPRWLPALTASAHGVPGLRRARRMGAALTFLSPAFATASHPGALALGPLRWGLAARRSGGAAALGGVTGQNIRRISRINCKAAGAIDAFR